MSKYLKFIPVLLWCLAGLHYSATAQTLAQATLDQRTIKIGEQTNLHIIVHQPLKEHVNFPQLTDSLTAKVLIVSKGKRDTAFDQNDKNRLAVTQSYVITCFDEGNYTIPSFSLGSSTGVIKTDSITLQVRTVRVDTTKAIYDIKQPIAVSYTLWDWLRDHWILVVSILVGVLIIIGIIWYLRTRPKKEPVVKEEKVYLPPHTIALNKLQELRQRKLWQDDVKQYHIELSDIIRDYLEQRYVIKTQEKTTDEIFAGIKHLDIKDENRSQLKQILVLADLVKFAKERPLPMENEQSMDTAIRFVTQTQPVTIAPNTEGGSANASV